MQRLEQRALGFKLGIGFSLLMGLILLIGVQGIHTSRESLKLLERSYESDLLGVSYIGRAESAFIRVGREMRQALRSADTHLREQSVALIRAHHAEVEANLSRVDDKIFREETRNALTQARSSFEHYYSKVDQICDQLAHNTESSNAEAVALFNSEAFDKAAKDVEIAFRHIVQAKETGARLTLKSAQEAATAVQHQAMVLLCCGLLLGLFAAWAIVRSIRKPLAGLQGAITGVARGELDRIVPYTDYPNEIGDMARSIKIMQQGAQSLQDERWVRQGTVELADALQQAEDQQQFGEIAISLLCPMLHCAMAVFHVIQENGQPICCATHGLNMQDDTVFSANGLVAQAARSGKLQVVRNVPTDYFRVESGLGSARPNVLILVPIPGRDGVLGVLELASFGEMSDLRHTFLIQVSKLLAPRLDVLNKNAATRALLEQTQQQAQALAASESALQARQGELEVQRRILREQLGFQQALMDAIPYPIFYKDGEGRYLGVNRAYEAAFGIDRATVLGKTVVDVDYLSREQQASFAALTREILEEGGQYREEFTIAYADHEPRETIYAISSFADEDGKISGLIGALIDISPQKAAQRAMAEAKEAAEEATRMKSDFLANMSHEIRTPMNAILGMSRLALDTELSAKQRNYINKVNLAATNLLGIINDILDFSKIEAGKMGLEMTEFRLEDVLENLASLIGLKAEEKGLELLFDTPASLPTALIGDPLRLGQILINLGNNAVKFTERGKIVVSVSAEPIVDGQVCMHFSVRDTGIGMTSEQCGRLFQAFSQADASTTRKYGGTGLGLAISRNLVDLMQGEIHVESVPGEGSNFSFSVMLGVQQAPQVSRVLLAEDKASARSQLEGARVLLVEDNEMNQELAVELLEQAGLKPVVVGDGQQALDLLAKDSAFDGILMDCQMPVMDGYEATRRMRADPALAKLPILAMTANAMAGDRDKVLAAGMNDHIPKPLQPEQMFATMARWIKPAEKPASSSSVRAQTSADEALPMLPGIDTTAGLATCAGNAALYRKQLLRFLQSQQHFAQDFAHAGQADDPDAATRCAHTLKGNAGNIGARELEQAAAALEAACNKRETAMIDQLLPKLGQTLATVLGGLAALAPAPATASSSTAVDVQSLLPQFTRLAEQLVDGDAEAVETSHELCAALAGTVHEAAMQKIDQAIDRFDFDAAHELLSGFTSALTVAH